MGWPLGIGNRSWFESGLTLEFSREPLRSSSEACTLGSENTWIDYSEGSPFERQKR